MRRTRMRTWLALCGSGVAVLSMSIGGAPPAGAQDPGAPKAAICHREADGSFHEITIAVPALPAHLAHGDRYPVPASGCPAAAGGGGGGTTRVTVCHREGNGTFHPITIDDNALPAHLAHGDRYPVPATGCPAPAGGGGGGTTRVTVCHREGNGTFHPITIDDNALPAHLAHGDRYPVPATGCPTPVPPTVIGGGGGHAPTPPARTPPPPALAAASGSRQAAAVPPAAGAATVASAVAPATSAKVVELPHTGPRPLGIEVTVGALLLLLGAASLSASRRAARPSSGAAPRWDPGPLPVAPTSDEVPHRCSGRARRICAGRPRGRRTSGAVVQLAGPPSRPQRDCRPSARGSPQEIPPRPCDSGTHVVPLPRPAGVVPGV